MPELYDEPPATPAEQAGEAEDSRGRIDGLLYAIGGAAAVAMNFVTAKYAMEGMTFMTFVTLWFVCAFSYSLLYLLVRRRAWYAQFRQHWKPLVGVGISHGLCALTGFAGLKLLDPTVAAFISRSSAVFGVLLALIFLRERPGGQTWAGMAVTALGIGIISYATGQAEQFGIALTLLAALLASVGIMFAKLVAHLSSTALIVAVRAATIVLMVGPFSVATGQFSFDISLPHLLVLAFGAIFGPFLSQLLFFRSLQRLSLSEVSVIRALSPVFVAIYAAVFLLMFPEPRQLIGGLVVLAGIVLLARARPVVERSNRRPPEFDAG